MDNLRSENGDRGPRARPLALVTGASSGIGLELARLLPDSAKAAMHRDMAQPGSGKR